MDILIPQEQDGMTVRQYLKDELKLSSAHLRHIKFLPNGITVNGERVTVRRVLQAGELLSLALEDEDSAPITPVDLPISVLYEDADIVLPAKPADMPTHPSHEHYTDTVANALAYRYAASGVPFVFRPVNRLDRNTSGVLLIARNRRAAGELTRAMQAGRIQKIYLAVLDGEMTEKDGVIDACLHRTEKSIIVREVCPPTAPDAAPSRTAYRVLAVQNGHTLVEARPLTGRTHQLRVHFAHLGYPITGDDLYGTPSADIARHALHARTLTLPHPADGRTVTVQAPLPDDLLHLLSLYFPDLSERKLP